MQRKRKKFLPATMGEVSAVGNQSIKSLAQVDRISELPDSILQHILSFLRSTREAVRTGILSKRWRNQWTRVPVLIFTPPTDSYGCPLASYDESEYLRFIETSLILHECPKIKKFHLEYNFLNHFLDPRFRSKIGFAVRKCVEELVLVSEVEYAKHSYLLPKFLLDCTSLVRLEMVGFPLLLRWRVNWPSLKSLTLKGVRYDDNRSKGIENVLSGSPLLERLELHLCALKDVAIVSESLKVLSFVNVDVLIAIRISCPNLVELNVVDGHVLFPFSDQMIKSVLSSSPLIHSLNLRGCTGPDKIVIASASLKVLSIIKIRTTMIEVSCPNLEKLDFYRQNGEIFQAQNLPASACATICYDHGLDHNSVMEMLGQFQHVDELTIGSSLFMYISELLYMEDRLSLPLLNSRCLTLKANASIGMVMPGIAYALRSPRLESLVMKLNFIYEDALSNDLQDYWNSDGCGDLTCLKTVKLIEGLYGTDGNCKLVLEFIECLLKNARVLEKMIVVLRKPSTGFMSKISKKLSSVPRYSQCVSVEVCST